MIEEKCVERQVKDYWNYVNERRNWHEWVLIKEIFKTDPVYWHATEEVTKRRWYCKFCRKVEVERL